MAQEEEVNDTQERRNFESRKKFEKQPHPRTSLVIQIGRGDLAAPGFLDQVSRSRARVRPQLRVSFHQYNVGLALLNITK